MGLTRDQRLAWQAYDPGDPDDEVWINTKPGTGRVVTYHDTLDCTGAKGGTIAEFEPRTRRAAQLRWTAPCRQCVIPVETPRGGFPDDPTDCDALDHPDAETGPEAERETVPATAGGGD